MSVSTRRERREKERQERARRTRAPLTHGSRGPRPTWIAAGVVVAAVAAVLAFGLIRPGPAATFDLRSQKYDTANDVIGTRLPDEGNAHIPAGQRGTFQQDPPTSGGHWGSPAGPVPWGIKDTTLPNEAVVHNLEHGGVLIVYKGLTDEETTQLKDLARTLMRSGFPKIVVEPYPQLTDARVALSAWDWQLKLPGFDDPQIVKFVRAHHSGADAPEGNLPP